MSAIDEGIVREFFEQNGFFVRQVRKYQVQARHKMADEEIDLLVHNPSWRKGSRKPDFLLFSKELQFVHQAVVAVKPWHTEVFTPAMLKGSPEIFGFLEQNVLKLAARLFPGASDEIGGGRHQDPRPARAPHGRALPLAERRPAQGARRRRDHLLPGDAPRPDREDRRKPQLRQERHAPGDPGPQDLRPAEGRPARPALRARAVGTQGPRRTGWRRGGLSALGGRQFILAPGAAYRRNLPR